MSDTMTGLDLTEIEAAAASDLLGMCSEAGYRDAVGILVAAVPSLLAAYRERDELRETVEEDAQKIDRLHRAWLAVEALLDQYDRYEEPMPSDRRHGRVARAEVRAALGTAE